HATAVGRRLKESVYDALRTLINGFVAFPQNELDPIRDIKEIHSQSLIVLYRLLFVLFAEDKRLLPLDNRLYESICLRTIHRQIHTRILAENEYHSQTTSLWRQFLDLCRLIDLGDSEHDIAQYNGGLFAPSKHPKIGYAQFRNEATWQIGDKY